MTQENNQINELDSPLLSDEEFVALIEHEFQRQGQPQNEVAKQKAWNNLQAQLVSGIPDHEANIQSPISTTFSEAITNIISVAAAAVLLLAIVPMFFGNGLLTTERVKGVGDFPLVNISAFAVKAGGELQPVSGTENQGSTIVFKVDTPIATAVALAMSKAEQPPQVRYRAGILPAGSGQLLKNSGQVYGYELEQGDRRLKVCAIASVSEKSLNRRLRLITRVWDRLPSASCVLINTN